MDTFRDLSIIELGQVMQYAKKIDVLIGLHAEEKDVVKKREEERRNAGKNTLDDYYYARSAPAEKNGVAIAVQLLRQTRSHLHIVHLSSGEGLKQIIKAKVLGLDISAETCPHFLEFTFEDFKRLGSLIKTAPVIKTDKDRASLWEGIADGSLDFIATDHAPCPLSEKNVDSGWDAYGGMPGVELMLPYLFSEGYMKKRITLARLVELTSTNAAKRFGLYPRKGVLEKGSDADMVFIDPAIIRKVKGEGLHSKAKWTSFEGMTFAGSVVRTIVRGKIIYDHEEGILSKPGYGNWVKREVKK